MTLLELLLSELGLWGLSKLRQMMIAMLALNSPLWLLSNHAPTVMTGPLAWTSETAM